MTATYSKHAAAADFFKSPYFQHAAIGAGLSAAAAGGQAAISRIMDAKAKAEAYKSMLDLHPHLRDDAKQVRRVFDSLYRVNPMLAQDPLVAGAWVDQIQESNSAFSGRSNQALLNAVKDLAGIRSHLSQSLRREGGFDAVRHGIEPVMRGFGDYARDQGEAEQLRSQLKTKQDEFGEALKRERDATRAVKDRAEVQSLMAREREQRMMQEQRLRGHRDRTQAKALAALLGRSNTRGAVFTPTPSSGSDPKSFGPGHNKRSSGLLAAVTR